MEDAMVTGARRVFISHTDKIRLDKSFTGQLVERFKREGINYWIDREHPFELTAQPGGDGPSPANPLFFHLCEAIASCDMFLFILSSESVDREFCRLEFDPRMLYGPAAAIMKGKSAMLVKLNDTGLYEMETVLTSLFGQEVFDMRQHDFEDFWDTFMEKYGQVKQAAPDDSWRRNPVFQVQPPEDDSAKELPGKDPREYIEEGRIHLRRGLDLVAEKKYAAAYDDLADAYESFEKAHDPEGIAASLHALYLQGIGQGLEIYTAPREVNRIGTMIIRDTHRMALDQVRYAMKCLRGCILELEKTEEPGKALEMEAEFSQALARLHTFGIEMVK